MWAAGQIHVLNTLSLFTERILLLFFRVAEKSVATVRLVYRS